MKEPIAHLLEKYPYKQSDIEKFVIGQRYCAVMLKTGEIGVSANIENLSETDFNLTDIQEINLSDYKHRVLANAYLNAKINISLQASGANEDIIEVVDFTKYRIITMIGYFKPVVEKLDKAGINLNIFDLKHGDKRIIKQDKLPEYTAKSDCIILTATTLANNTFYDIVNNTKDGTEIFILGPSSVMHEDIFKYKNISTVFGLTFRLFDYRILDIIKNDEGTRKFIRLSEKISYRKK